MAEKRKKERTSRLPALIQLFVTITTMSGWLFMWTLAYLSLIFYKLPDYWYSYSVNFHEKGMDISIDIVMVVAFTLVICALSSLVRKKWADTLPAWAFMYFLIVWTVVLVFTDAISEFSNRTFNVPPFVATIPYIASLISLLLLPGKWIVDYPDLISLLHLPSDTLRHSARVGFFGGFSIALVGALMIIGWALHREYRELGLFDTALDHGGGLVLFVLSFFLTSWFAKRSALAIVCIACLWMLNRRFVAAYYDFSPFAFAYCGALAGLWLVCMLFGGIGYVTGRLWGRYVRRGVASIDIEH